MVERTVEGHVLFQLEQPDEAGCVWARSWAGSNVWRHNLGPVAAVREALSAWLKDTRPSETGGSAPDSLSAGDVGDPAADVGLP